MFLFRIKLKKQNIFPSFYYFYFYISISRFQNIQKYPKIYLKQLYERNNFSLIKFTSLARKEKFLKSNFIINSRFTLIFTRRNIRFTILYHYRTPFILRANANLPFRCVQILVHLILVYHLKHTCTHKFYPQFLSRIRAFESNQAGSISPRKKQETTVPLPIIVTRHLTICCSNSIVHPPIPLI